MSDHRDHNLKDELGCGALSSELEASFLDVIAGEAPSVSLEAHAITCSICRDELAELAQLASLLVEDAEASAPGELFFGALHRDIMSALP